MKLLPIIAAILAVTAFPAQAQDFSYDYIEADYVYFDQDDLDFDGDGFAIGGSWSPISNMFIAAAYGEIEADDYPVEQETVSLTLGGYAHITDSVDAEVGLVGLYSDTDADFIELEDYGLGVYVDTRYWATSNIELNLGLAYADYFSGDSDDLGADTDEWTAGLGFRFYFTPKFSLGTSYSYAFDAEVHTVSAGLRLNF